MENKPIKKKKKFVPGATKALLALTSVAGTVGLWNVISNQSLVEAQQANSTIEGTLEFSSLPTVVPLTQVTLRATLEPGATPNPPLSSLRVVAPPATAVPVVHLPAGTAKPAAPASNNNDAAQAPAASNPAATAVQAMPAPSTPVPTTTTGSSK